MPRSKPTRPATPEFDDAWDRYLDELRLRVEEQTRAGRVQTLEPPLDRTLPPPSGTTIADAPGGALRRLWRWIRG